MKRKYEVLVKKEVVCENPEDNFSYDIGSYSTYASSKQQAINNIRFRVAGLNSQYKPVCTSGHHDDFITYQVKEVK